MIQIQQTTSNEVFLTLTELSTLESPVYLFQFICDQSKEEFTFIAADESEYTDRYNKFTIIEKVNPDNLEGEVRLAIKGYYTYKVWEQVSTTNLDPPDTDPLEQGKVRVAGTSDTVYTHDYPTETTVYNP